MRARNLSLLALVLLLLAATAAATTAHFHEGEEHEYDLPERDELTLEQRERRQQAISQWLNALRNRFAARNQTSLANDVGDERIKSDILGVHVRRRNVHREENELKLTFTLEKSGPREGFRAYFNIPKKAGTDGPRADQISVWRDGTRLTAVGANNDPAQDQWRLVVEDPVIEVHVPELAGSNPRTTILLEAEYDAGEMPTDEEIDAQAAEISLAALSPTAAAGTPDPTSVAAPGPDALSMGLLALAVIAAFGVIFARKGAN